MYNNKEHFFKELVTHGVKSMRIGEGDYVVEAPKQFILSINVKEGDNLCTLEDFNSHGIKVYISSDTPDEMVNNIVNW